MFAFDISSREALADPTTAWQTHIQSEVIMIISIFSVLGATWIIASFAAFPNLRSFRHQLILGLAISDFIMAANFLASSSMDVAGDLIGAPAKAKFCSFNGWMTQTFVIQTDYWVLTIAICTYLILAGHKQAAMWAQDHRIIISCLLWFLSMLWASIGLRVAGYGDIGAWCWFTSDEVRLLVNFIPRWTIIIIMLLMYARLYFILYRTHSNFLSLDVESSGNAIGSRNLDNRPRVWTEHHSFGESDRSGRRSRTNRTLKNLARRMMVYPLAYAVIWSLPTGIRIYQASTGRAAPWQVQTVDKSCIVIQGFVDAIIYGVNESSLASWRDLLWRRNIPVVEGVDLGGRGPPRSPTAEKGPAQKGPALKRPMSGSPLSSPTDSTYSLEIGRSGYVGHGVEMYEMRDVPRSCGGASSGSGKMINIDVRIAVDRSQYHVPMTLLPSRPLVAGRSFYRE